MLTTPEPLIVVNTSPLLYLYQVGCLDLLQKLYSKVTVPPAVPQELMVGNLYRLKYTGTLGVLVKAKQTGYLPSVSPVIAMLRSKGMWLTDKIINNVLELSGE